MTEQNVKMLFPTTVINTLPPFWAERMLILRTFAVLIFEIPNFHISDLRDTEGPTWPKAQAWPSPAQGWPGPDFWGPGNLGPGNLEMLDPKKSKRYRTQNLCRPKRRQGVDWNKILLAPFVISGNFLHGPEYLKKE